MLNHVLEPNRHDPALECLGSSCLLIHGDALTWISRLTGFHAVVTDPPYCSGGISTASRKQCSTRKYSSDRCKDFPNFSGESRDQRSHQMFTERWMHAALCAALPTAHLLCFSDFRQIPLTSDALQLAGWRWDGMAVWDKINGRPKPNGVRMQTEFILHGTRNVLNIPGPDAVYLPGLIRQSLVPQQERLHLTQKPVELMRQLVNIVPVGGVVLDPFGGSGSTAVAALNSGRKVIVIEDSELIYPVCKNRILKDALNQHSRTA